MRSVYQPLTMLALAVLLAACAPQRSSAPIVSRTGDAARAGQPRVDPGAPAVTPPPGAAAPAPTQPESGVQTAPVRSGGIETRSLETRPLGGTAAVPGAAGAPQGVTPGGTTPGVTASSFLRSGPKAVKRPYSDTALAEVKAADAAMKNANLPAGLPIKPDTAAADAARAEAAKAEAAKAEAAKAEAAKAEAAKAEAARAEAANRVDPKDAKNTNAAPSSLSFDWPTRGKVLQGFAEPKNVGIVLDGKTGDPVSAAADGKVIFSGPGPRGYGNLLIVKHDPETVSVYAHNKNLLVKEGQSVKRGQKIAEVGDSGADRVGLHFEIRKQGKPVDPQKILPKR